MITGLSPELAAALDVSADFDGDATNLAKGEDIPMTVVFTLAADAPHRSRARPGRSRSR
ncbi:hypothetical protein NKG05_09125 [Oerskovia sp. M15]